MTKHLKQKRVTIWKSIIVPFLTTDTFLVGIFFLFFTARHLPCNIMIRLSEVTAYYEVWKKTAELNANAFLTLSLK